MDQEQKARVGEALRELGLTRERRGKLLLAPCPGAVLDRVLEPPLGVGPQPPERRAEVSCEITGEARRRISAGWFLVAHFRRSFLAGRRRCCAQGLTATLTGLLTATLTGGEIARFPVA